VVPEPRKQGSPQGSGSSEQKNCLRCPSTALRLLPGDPTQTIAFLQCPACLRHYAQKAGGLLPYRWGHPISLALYGVLFTTEPLTEAQRIADALRQGRTPEALALFIEEIELELAHPTQQVRDILGNTSPEAACREFLAAVVRHLTLTPTPAVKASRAP